MKKTDIMKKIKIPTIEKLIKKGYYYVNSDITTQNFPVPDIIEQENFKIIKMEKSFTSQEALDRIKAEGCRPGNIYELALLKKNFPEQWPKGKWSSIISFGSEYTDFDGDHRVPFVLADSDGDFGFHLGDFGDGWGAEGCLLCFCDKQLSEALALKEDISSLDTSVKKKKETTDEKLDRIIALLEQQNMRDRFSQPYIVPTTPQPQLQCHYHNGIPCWNNPCFLC